MPYQISSLSTLHAYSDEKPRKDFHDKYLFFFVMCASFMIDLFVIIIIVIAFTHIHTHTHTTHPHPVEYTQRFLN